MRIPQVMYSDTETRKVQCISYCVSCGRPTSFSLTSEEGRALANELMSEVRTKHIQDILPHQSPDIRELFITGLCSKCFRQAIHRSGEEIH